MSKNLTLYFICILTIVMKYGVTRIKTATQCLTLSVAVTHLTSCLVPLAIANWIIELANSWFGATSFSTINAFALCTDNTHCGGTRRSVKYFCYLHFSIMVYFWFVRIPLISNLILPKFWESAISINQSIVSIMMDQGTISSEAV